MEPCSHLLVFISMAMKKSKAFLPQKDTCSDWRLAFTLISGGWFVKDICATMSLLIRFFCMEETKTQSNFVRNIPQFQLIFCSSKTNFFLWYEFFFLVLQLIFCFSRTNFFRVFLSDPMLLFLENFSSSSSSSSSQVTAYITGRSKMKTKCQFITGYKSTIKFSYSQPPKKRRRKKKPRTHQPPKQRTQRNAHTTIQLSEKLSLFQFWVTKDREIRDTKLNFGGYFERHEDFFSSNL